VCATRVVVCFTEAGMIVLGACDGDGGRYWNLLGGGVEPGETLEDCLVREVMEEGWARVELLRWDPQREIDERLVRPEDFLGTLAAIGSKVKREKCVKFAVVLHELQPHAGVRGYADGPWAGSVR
jgi:8-oxo-dGTP pyrophosphatase MutT (NUDIX family)